MSLAEFQRALSDLAASPGLCRTFRSRRETLLSRYELSVREQQRLAAVSAQRGMATHCGLYRANRITPVYTLLPLTCFALGDELAEEAERFWSACEDTDLQFKQEINRFAAFVRDRLSSGQLENPFLEEVLDFELATNALRYLPRRQVAQSLIRRGEARKREPLRLHPLVRVVAFRHEPSALLELLNAMKPPPYQLIEGEFFLLLDARGEDLVVKRIHPLLGRLLRTIESGARVSLSTDDSEALISAGMVVRGIPGTAATGVLYRERRGNPDP